MSGAWLLLLAGCGADGTADSGATGTCTEQVRIGFYEDDRCEPGTESAELVFDLARDCHSWSRSTGGGATRDNSATHFQCRQDRLCYTQHVETVGCDSASPTDKIASTVDCLQEPTGEALWSRILSGTEGCPVADEGFSCPESALGGGTSGVGVCLEEGAGPAGRVAEPRPGPRP